jgi:hypothetical protein
MFLRNPSYSVSLPTEQQRKPIFSNTWAVVLLVEAIISTLGLALMLGRCYYGVRRRRHQSYIQIVRDRHQRDGKDGEEEDEEQEEGEKKPFIAS